MKKIFILMIAILISQNTFADGGDHAGNGGDRRAIEFVDIATTLSTQTLQGVDAQAFLQTIKATTVESTDEALSLNSIPKDAINNPSTKKILFNRGAWDRQENYLSKAIFVLHEYLGVMNIDDSRYQISTNLVRGLWLINGTDAETMIDILEENHFAVEKAVHGVTRMADVDLITCKKSQAASATSYNCVLTGKNLKYKPIKVPLEERKAREVWTLLTTFQNAQCFSDVCELTVREVACQGENTREDRPAFCTAKQ